MDDLLKGIYYNPAHPAAFGGVAALAKASGVPVPQVKEWLKSQSTYTLHRTARKRYSTRPYATSGINHQWQADLVDMQAFASNNDGYKYILTVIDCFSRKAWAEPLKSKTIKDVRPAFDRIFGSNNKPFKIQSDQGSEFESKSMRQYFNSKGIEQFSVKSQYKGAIIERFNRTLKTKMWRYFTWGNTRRWIDVLPDLMQSYNNSYHRIIKMTPTQVTRENEMDLWLKQEPLTLEATTKKVQVGDYVRLSKVKGAFEKGYLPNWTEEVFKVHSISKTTPIQVKVEDLNGNLIIGSYYLPEILKVTKPEEFRIEKVLKSRRRAGIKEYEVKWLGYPSQFNSWVPENHIRRLQ